ncbi:MAG: AzlD domain-containing protein [Lachnospiraceae bacterium]|nr:AzlD domain-containing protein [Lachnospiraceae bacterium]
MHNAILIVTLAVVTMLTRSLPFIIFKNETPPYIKYLSTVLPTAIIGMLVVYCLKDIELTKYPFTVKEIIAVILVIILQAITRNSIISVIGGTIVYMIIK